MARFLKQAALAAAAATSLVVFGATAAQAQFACTAFEHPHYKGRSAGLAVNGSAANSKVSNNISSFKMVRGCRVVAYSEANFRGPNVQFTRDTPVFDRRWDNIISSYRCICR